MGTTRSVLGKLVAELAGNLQETQSTGILALIDIASTLGEETCRRLVADTLAVQARGGATKADGSQRTLGGIFISLAGKEPVHANGVAEPASRSPQDEIAALLRTLAACAYDVASMIPAGAESLSDAAQQRLNDLRSIWGCLAATFRPAAGTQCTKPALPQRAKTAIAIRVNSVSGKNKPLKKPQKFLGSRPKKPRKPSEGRVKKPRVSDIAPPGLGFARPAHLNTGSGFIFRGVGGKKPGSHSEGRHG